MATARKCDRCGKLYEWYHQEHDGLDVNAVGLFINLQMRIAYDLCPECLTEFIEWFEGGEKK